MTRPSFQQIYMQFAQSLARRSTCARAQVGCVITSQDHQRVLSVGYNGSYKGGPNGCDSAEPGKCGCLHAEENALIKLDYNDPVKKRMYTTMSPCVLCAKRVINANIDEVVYLDVYRDRDGLDLLRNAGPHRARRHGT